MWQGRFMSLRTVRKRLAAAGERRTLTDGEAKALLDAPKSINLPVVWTQSNVRRWRMDVPVVNELGEALKMTGGVSVDLRGMSSWTLTWGNKAAGEFPAAIRRLDLRGKHEGSPDGSVWDYETHKHLWSEAFNNAEAYTPDDIPHTQPGDAQTPDDLRAIFEAFVAECGVTLGPGYVWSEPTFDSADTNSGLWEV